MSSAKPRHTPIRAVRVSDVIWTGVQARAAGEGVTVTSVVVNGLRSYASLPPVAREPRLSEARPKWVPDDLWLAAKAKAEDEGTTVSAVLVERLREYVMPPPPGR